MSAQSSTHKALQSLLSKDSIPPKLLSQAESLLSLSYQRAPNLKSEEEIARAHACAEIAAKRLRLVLRLPNVKSGAGAPAKPAVYKKLVGFLEGILGSAGSVTTPTSAKKRPADGGATGTPTSSVKRARTEKDQNDEIDGTPTKRKKTTDTNDFLGTIRNVPRKQDAAGSAPDYAMPSVRRVCREFGTATLAPHVYTGVCVILKEAELWPVKDVQNADEQKAQKEAILALIIAVYLLVLTRMKKGKMTTPAYTTISSRGSEILDLQPQDPVKLKIEDWISRINREGWATEQDWWSSVPENVLNFSEKTMSSNGVEDIEMLDVEVGSASKDSELKVIGRHFDILKKLEEPEPEGVLLPGLGTMMQDAIDFLSEDRRAEQVRWIADIEKTLTAMDRQATKRGKAVAAI